MTPPILICDECGKTIGIMRPADTVHEFDTSYICWECFIHKHLNTKLKREEENEKI
jgi:hypothetical protein